MRRFAPIAVVPLVALALAACGSTTDGKKVATAGEESTTTTSKASKLSDDEKRRKFEQCMKDNGVDVGGETDESGGAVGKVEEASPKEQAAFEKCREFAPVGKAFAPKPPTAEDIAKRVKYAKCMREHGVDLPDAPVDAKGAQQLPFDPESKKFKDAFAACREHAAPPIQVGGGQ